MDFIDLHELAARPHSGVKRHQAAPVHRRLRPPPILTAGPVPRDFAPWYFGDREAPPASLFIIENLTLSGDSVLSKGDTFLTLPQNGIHHGVTTGFDAAKPVRKIAGGRVLLSGPAYQMYGHWLVDFCPRLHVLTALGLDITKVPLLLPNNLATFSLNWLSQLGITQGQVEFYNPLAERVQIEQAIIPTTLRGNGRASPLLAGAVTDFKRRMLGDDPVSDQRKLFVSRRNWKNDTRRLSNLEAVEQIFRDRGFEIVIPEQLAVADQVRLFSGARIIAGEYGSALHNAMFAPAGSLSIALRGTEAHPGFLHSGLCEVLNQNCAYVFGDTEILAGNQVYSIVPDDLHLSLDLLDAC
jgi:capsular polysaccharide biosynthesis protein